MLLIFVHILVSFCFQFNSSCSFLYLFSNPCICWLKDSFSNFSPKSIPLLEFFFHAREILITSVAINIDIFLIPILGFFIYKKEIFSN